MNRNERIFRLQKPEIKISHKKLYILYPTNTWIFQNSSYDMAFYVMLIFVISNQLEEIKNWQINDLKEPQKNRSLQQKETI